MNAPVDHDAPLRELAALVCKQGVSLGGLPPPLQRWALALAWSALPQGVAMREADVNAALKCALADVLSFVDTDHVELRRWLVDGQWLQRDGFGREYRRVPREALRPECAAPALALPPDPAQWVRAERRAREAGREARRAAWQASQGTAPRHDGASR